MQKIKFCLSLVILLFILSSCDDKYKIKLNSPKSIQIHKSLNISVKEQNNKPLDSVRYYIDGIRVATNKKLDINKYRLGTHALSATVFYGDKQKQLSNTIIFLAQSSPEIYTYKIIKEYPHDNEAFTQGLEYHNGFLYESTGEFGKTSLRKVDLSTGKVLKKIELDKKYFGEGMTIFNNKIYMLTWQNMVGFVFNLETFEKEKEFSYQQSKEGWGLTHNNEKLIKTDGTERMWFLNPSSLAEESYIEIYTDKRKVEKLNEIEYIHGKIYANIWQKNSILIVNHKTGAIEGIADMKGLQTKAGQSGDDYVLNGIAYDETNDRLFVTGKDWNKLFEIKLIKKH
jgi:glutamine cyclotransferase